jgi:hypothetical protein
MKKNVGNIDKAIRFFIALVAVYFAYTNKFGNTVSYVLYAVAIIMLIVVLIGSCPLYSVFGCKTTDKKE